MTSKVCCVYTERNFARATCIKRVLNVYIDAWCSSSSSKKVNAGRTRRHVWLAQCFFPGHSKLAPNNGRAQSYARVRALLGILTRSWAANIKLDVPMKLINTKYQTPPPHQFFASGRFDVIAADVSFRDIERRGEWNGRGRGRREGGGCVCVCAEIRFAWTTIHPRPFTRASCIGRFKNSFPWNCVENCNPRLITFHSIFRLKRRINANRMRSLHHRNEGRDLFLIK